MIPDDPTGRWHLDDLQQESRRLVLGPRGSRDSRGRGKFVAVNLFTGRTTSGSLLIISKNLDKQKHKCKSLQWQPWLIIAAHLCSETCHAIQSSTILHPKHTGTSCLKIIVSCSLFSSQVHGSAEGIQRRLGSLLKCEIYSKPCLLHPAPTQES